MAKLSARGRTEIARFARENSYVNIDGETVSYVEKFALMSDRKVLRNSGHGWKVAGTLREGITPDEWISKRENSLTYRRIVR